MLWLWIVLLVVGAAIVCLLLFVYEKRKQIFRKRTKEEKQAKKQARTIKKQAKTHPVQQEKPKSEISLTEKLIEIIPEEDFQQEEYSPSAEFVEEEVLPPVRRVQRRVRPNDNFEQFRRNHGYSQALKQSVKEQIINLSPEMKALLLTGVLERKDDNQF